MALNDTLGHVASTGATKSAQVYWQKFNRGSTNSEKPQKKSRKKKLSAKEMGVDAALAAVLAKLNGIFTLQEEQTSSAD